MTAKPIVEQAGTFGWERYAGLRGDIIGMHTFGASAPLKELQQTFGFTAAHVVAAGREQWKGRVMPGTHRAFGYQAPGHLTEDLKLLWRDRRMRFGLAREGSSPQIQEDAGLNRDATHSPAKGEGEKLRE